MRLCGQRSAARIKYQNLFARIHNPNPLTLIIHTLIIRAACATIRVLVNIVRHMGPFHTEIRPLSLGVTHQNGIISALCIYPNTLFRKVFAAEQRTPFAFKYCAIQLKSNKRNPWLYKTVFLVHVKSHPSSRTAAHLWITTL